MHVLARFGAAGSELGHRLIFGGEAERHGDHDAAFGGQAQELADGRFDDQRVGDDAAGKAVPGGGQAQGLREHADVEEMQGAGLAVHADDGGCRRVEEAQAAADEAFRLPALALENGCQSAVQFAGAGLPRGHFPPGVHGHAPALMKGFVHLCAQGVEAFSGDDVNFPRLGVFGRGRKRGVFQHRREQFRRRRRVFKGAAGPARGDAGQQFCRFFIVHFVIPPREINDSVRIELFKLLSRKER